MQTLPAQEPANPAAPLDQLLEIPISTAARYEQRLASVPASVTVITAEDIRRYGWETLADALNAVRGLYISNDRNYTYLGVRGIGRPTDFNNRLLVMIDGHSTNEHIFGSSAVGSDLALDLADVERIEFVRGPGSVLYGSGAMLGVLNVITRRAQAGHQVRVEASAGSAQRRGASFSLGGVIGATDWTVAVNRRSIEGADLRFAEYAGDGGDGIAHDLDFDDVLGVLATVGHGDFRGTGFLGRRQKGIPTGAYGTNFDERSDTLDERSFFDASYAPRLSPHAQIEARVFHDRYHYAGTYAYDNVFRDVAEGAFSGVEVRALLDPRANHRVTLGVRFIDELRMEYGSADGTDRTESNTDTLSLYAQHEFQPRENLSLVAGIRADRQVGYDARLTPRLAVVYHPWSSSSLKLLYGEAFRSPTPWERDYESEELGYLANKKLRDETIRTSEIVWEQRITPEVLVLFSAYQFAVDRLIDAEEVEGPNPATQFVNRGSVRSRGVELEVNHRSAAGVWSFAHYSIQRAHENGRTLTNSPQHIASAGISGRILPRVESAIEVLYESSRATLQATDTRGFLIANVNVSTRVSKSLRLSAQIRNAFDARYEVPAGIEHRQAAIAQDGRNFVIRLAYIR